MHSGAVYTDPTLWRMGLIGEGTFDRTVIAVKSHYSKGVNYRDSRPRFQLTQYDQVRSGGCVVPHAPQGVVLPGAVCGLKID